MRTLQSLRLQDMLAEREQLREEEKGSPHLGMLADEESKGEEKDLDAQLAEDPYVKEGSDAVVGNGKTGSVTIWTSLIDSY